MKHFSDLSLKYKLFLLCLALILVPFLFYTNIVITQASRESEQTAANIAGQVLHQTGQFVQSRIETVKRALDFITLDSTVKEQAVLDPQIYKDNLEQWNIDAQVLRRVTSALRQNNPDIARFVLYMEKGLGSIPEAEESSEFRWIDEYTDTTWYQRVNTKQRAFWWFSSRTSFDHSETSEFHGIRKIRDDQNLQKIIGYARVDIPVSILSEILDKAEFTPTTKVALINSYGETIATSSHSQPGQDGMEFFYNSRYYGMEDIEEEWFTQSFQGQVFRAGVLRIPDTDWVLLLMIPMKDITAFGDKTRGNLFFLLLIIIPLTLPLAFWVASTSTRRLATLLAGVRKISSGGLDVELPVKGLDEVGQLTRSFNQMVARIRELADERFRLGQEIKSHELTALQSQINPHFLYNTLELINCLALEAQVPRITEAVSALSRFYRQSLSGGASHVTVADEIRHAQTYLEIQNMRFDRKVELVTEVDSEAAVCRIVKIVLQPIVENALLHGIMEGDAPTGRIRIRARIEDHGGLRAVNLSVEDNGIGMDQQALDQVRRKLEEPPSAARGYGIYNIHQRLKLLYGKDYGIHIESRLHQGTTVFLLIPAQE